MKPISTKNKSLFDHINHIREVKSPNYFDTLSEADKKSYSNYMVNKFLSMNVHQVPYVNELQKYTLTPELHYAFFSRIIPKGRQFNKYIKKTKDVKYEEWLVNIVVRHYNVSIVEAEEYLQIYYKHDKAALRKLCEAYGVDNKQLKRVKL